MGTTLGERVRKALNGPPKRSQKELAQACGITAVSVNDWVHDRTKSLDGANLLRAAQFLQVSARWLAEGIGPMRGEASTGSADVFPAPRPRGMAHDLSQVTQIVDIPHLEWELLMSTKLPPAFGLFLRDDAMSPDFPRGGFMRFSTTARVKPGRIVLVADAKEHPYIRKYQLHRADHWHAVALNPDYGSFDSEVDGITILAVMTGWDYPPDQD